APAVFLLLRSLHWDELAWGAMTLGQYYVLCFAGLSFYFLTQDRDGKPLFQFLSVLFAALAAFTLANGLLASLVALGYFLYLRQFKRSLLWCAVAMSLWGFYFFFHYLKAGPPLGTVSVFPSAVYFFRVLFATAHYFFVSLGSAFAFGNVTLAYALGLALFAGFIHLTRNGYARENPAVYLFLAFNVFSIAAVAWGRNRSGIQTALTQRYLLASLTTVILTYIGVLEERFAKDERRKIPFACYTGALALALALIPFPGAMQSFADGKADLVRSVNRWLTTNEGLLYKRPRQAGFVMTALLKSNLYRPPSEAIEVSGNRPSLGSCAAGEGEALRTAYDIVAIPSGGVRPSLIRVEGILLKDASPEPDIRVVLKSERGREYLFAAHAVNASRLGLYLAGEKDLEHRRFAVLIDAGALEPGTYRAGVCVDGRAVFHDRREATSKALAHGLWSFSSFAALDPGVYKWAVSTLLETISAIHPILRRTV
ncbi:MAG: hypothetical protein HZA02_00535, partial [Nitrospinae bacterium]|nr:hypothetical protein [Nitrospinota bacterium]